MTKLSLADIENAVLLEDDSIDLLEDEVDSSVYRNTMQRKEIRNKRKREDGELVGSGDIRKHRKY